MTEPIPVLWWNDNPGDVIARGYWDQGILEAILSGELWDVAGGYTFEHVERRGRSYPAPMPGAIVVVPARHNAAVEHVVALQEVISRLGWVLLVLTGDEEGAFPVGMLRHPRMRVWLMTPQAGRDYPEGTRLFGSGWPPGIRAALRDVDGEKRLPWAFLGQVTHERRRELAALLRQRPGDGELLETEGFTLGAAQPAYWRALAAAKVAPCPSGPVSPDSFRVYEALEAGCVPLADDVSPRSQGPEHYWERVFGSVPFPTVTGSWIDQGEVLDQAVAGWPGNANRAFAWWQRQKRRMARQLHLDVAELSGASPPQQSTGAAVTAIIVTSATPRCPEIDHLETTVLSVRERLPDSEIILVFDGLRPELSDRAGVYAEYVRRALWAANTRWGNVVPLVLDEWLHQARATRRAIDEVATRHMLFVEHDTPLTRDVDFAGISAALDSGEVDVVRLHHETAIGEHHVHMMLDREPRPGPVPLIRTSQWSQRPHVAATGWYRQMLDRHFAPEARCMIEDVMHGVVACAWHDYGIAGWHRFKVAMYVPDDPDRNIQRSLHLDTRRRIVGEEESGDPKFPMLFAYPGEPPEGAPRPGRR